MKLSFYDDPFEKNLSDNTFNKSRIRVNRKRLMCYPEDFIKGYWDLFISLALILTCSLTPYALAFNESNDMTFHAFDIITDIAFAIDIIIIFNTAFYNSEFELIDSYS